jgi:hypothetical protein
MNQPINSERRASPRLVSWWPWQHRAFSFVLLAAGLLAASGCGRQPQIAQSNLRLVQSLHTAVSAGRGDWLDANEKLVEERRTAGRMTDEEYAIFHTIITDAKSGNQKQALATVSALAKGQRRSAEEIDKLKTAGRP